LRSLEPFEASHTNLHLGWFQGLQEELEQVDLYTSQIIPTKILL